MLFIIYKYHTSRPCCLHYCNTGHLDTLSYDSINKAYCTSDWSFIGYSQKKINTSWQNCRVLYSVHVHVQYSCLFTNIFFQLYILIRLCVLCFLSSQTQWNISFHLILLFNTASQNFYLKFMFNEYCMSNFSAASVHVLFLLVLPMRK